MTDTADRPAANPDDQMLTLAFYIVVDVSYSMQQSGAIDDANKILPEVIDAITSDHTLSDVVRLGMIDFSDDARVVLRLGDLRDVKHIPQCVVRGGTSYAAAFRLLRQEIESDIAQLKADGLRVHRPAVFFITDGAPTDDLAILQAAYQELTDSSFRARPNIIPFGVGTATPEAVDPWVYPKNGSKPMRSYVAKPGVNPAHAINQAAEMLISSIVASAGSVSTAGDSGGFVPPEDEDLDVWM